MFKFKKIVPGKLNVQAMRKSLEVKVRQLSNGVKKDLDATTETWDGDKPTFEPKFTISRSAITMSLYGTGSEKGINKWIWLDKGTKERKAIMTPGFVPKTVPGLIGSRPGQGGLLRMSTLKPKPGIKARGWEEDIAAKWTKIYIQELGIHMAAVALASGHFI